VSSNIQQEIWMDLKSWAMPACQPWLVVVVHV
jgi:hypothetical protein